MPTMPRLICLPLVVAILVAGAIVVPARGEVGLKAGVNISGMSGGIKAPPESGVIFGAGDIENQVGFFAGAFASLRTDVFSLQPEVVVSQKGGKGAFLIADEPGREVQGTLSMTYIEVPVLFLFHPPTDVAVKPYVGAGPTTSWLLTASAESDEPDVTLNTDFIEGFDFSFTIVGGVGINAILIEVRYALGLIEVFKGDNNDLANQTFTAALGYSF